MRFEWTVFSAAVLILLAADDGVDAAPEPCFGLLNSRHYHYHDAKTEAPTTKPTPENEVTEVRRNRMKRLEKLVQEWLMPWTASASSSGESQSKFMDSFVTSYYDLITFLFNMFSY